MATWSVHRWFISSRLMRGLSRFYLRSSMGVSVVTTTVIALIITVSTTAILQAALGPGLGRGFWIGISIALIVPLVIAPPFVWIIVGLLHQLQNANRIAYELAYVDELTQLKTRRRFLIEATREFERATATNRPVVLLVIDLDRFKQINDEHGHLSGDHVLVAVAHACRESLRADDILARHGGDELAAMLPRTNLPESLVIAERIRFAVARLSPQSQRPTQDAPSPITVTVSIGAAQYQPGQSLNELFIQADLAMYQAKQAGRNQIRQAGVTRS